MDEVGEVGESIRPDCEGVGSDMVAGWEEVWCLVGSVTERRGKVLGLRERVGGGGEPRAVEEVEEGAPSESVSSD